MASVPGASKSRRKAKRAPPRQTGYVFSGSISDFLAPPLASTSAINAPVETVVERVSGDGRRVNKEVLMQEAPSPIKRQRRQYFAADGSAPDPPDPPELEPRAECGFDPTTIDIDRYDMELGGYFDRPAPPPTSGPRVKKFTPSDKSMYEWRALRDDYLQEMMRFHSCGDLDNDGGGAEDECALCEKVPGTIRCRVCFGGALYCRACCVKIHKSNPLHIIEEWDGTSFTRITLRDLGLRVQFGHENCPRPRVGSHEFVVLDMGYIHVAAVDFCGCEKAASFGHPRKQLLRRGWYPATHGIPKSGATLRGLEFFIALTLQSKTTMYDYYTTLEKVTDPTGNYRPPYRYREFLRMSRQLRHLLMLERAGIWYLPGGVCSTQPGQLALDCPACPRPGVNLPDGWENAPPELKFLYALFLALDACFRLKRRMVSSDLRDPGLGTGWAYFVENEPYRKYLLTVTDQKEMSTCSGLAALDYANTKFSRGYSTTGVGMGVCARHDGCAGLLTSGNAADTRTSTGYANIDWIFASILHLKDDRLFKTVSYDIICQWWKHLLERLEALPLPMRQYISLILFAFVIPKMHIHSHTLACQVLFSLNFLSGAGQTDGEGIERPWANLGGVATSTREMGPGSRHDTLDCHLHYWNWTKLTSIGKLLRRRYNNAVRERDSQVEAFELFSQEQSARVPVWKKMVEDYEAECVREKNHLLRKVQNPYEIKVVGITEAQVRLQFAEEEAASTAPPLHDVSAGTFVFAGLELEDQQRRLRIQAELKKAGTTVQKINLLSQRRKLTRGVFRFRKLQATYTPGALQALARRPANPEETAEEIPLMLPSAISSVSSINKL
ncbi:hypothetical protein C8F04DRAFT_1267965 [Mycena alexandri]|uniref:CxC2-like cysteine cluster KDZ transposase-associated domain-containing protein n=1 Tax=Mycena alexandri TaxID=1745969 RepID=A0AAD6SGB6_9AGAR|nr:hypothetical protein C8F04DRAFT_1267965 [Mycena alexandri]